jgi:hypothetical protein
MAIQMQGMGPRVGHAAVLVRLAGWSGKGLSAAAVAPMAATCQSDACGSVASVLRAVALPVYPPSVSLAALQQGAY